MPDGGKGERLRVRNLAGAADVVARGEMPPQIGVGGAGRAEGEDQQEQRGDGDPSHRSQGSFVGVVVHARGPVREIPEGVIA